MKIKRGLIVLFVLLLIVSFAIAHEEEREGEKTTEKLYPFKTLNVALFGILSIGIFLLIVIFLRRSLNEKNKTILYSVLVLSVSITTIYFIITTIHVNVSSETGGPVHWHADFEVWDCGGHLDLLNPKGISNKMGSELLHEHTDNRIHVEGPVLHKGSADLHSFFEVVGGKLESNSISFPTERGFMERKNGDLCNGKEGRLQVFVYKMQLDNKNTFAQEKLAGFENYILSPYSSVPPGDCIIIEFDEEKDRTDKLCSSYKSQIQKGKIKEQKE